MQQTPDPMGEHHIVWQVPLPADVLATSVSWNNPTDKFTNSDLELSENKLRHTCMSYFYDVWERTNLARIDIMSGI